MIDRLRHIVLQRQRATLAAIRQLSDRKSLMFVLVVVIAFLLLSVLLHLPHGPQHWTADLVAAHWSKRLTTQHEKIALVYVSEETLKPYPYLSPVNRELLAELVKAIDAAKPSVIGWDFVVDRESEPKNDRLLQEAMRNAQAKLVFGVVHTSDPEGARIQDHFLEQAGICKPGRSRGHLHFYEHHNPFLISDYVVRHMSKDRGHDPDSRRFASSLAKAANVEFEPKSRYISWLLRPTDGNDQFLTLTAEQVLGRTAAKFPVGDLLQGKIVLVGGNFSDRDQHLTPLSVSSHARYPGLFIHAQMLAQLLERSSLHEAGAFLQAVIVLVSFGLGFSVGRVSKQLPLVLELASVASLVLAAAAAFIWLGTILPYNAIAVSWLAGLAAGHYSKPAHAHA